RSRMRRGSNGVGRGGWEVARRLFPPRPLGRPRDRMETEPARRCQATGETGRWDGSGWVVGGAWPCPWWCRRPGGEGDLAGLARSLLLKARQGEDDGAYQRRGDRGAGVRPEDAAHVAEGCEGGGAPVEEAGA